MVEASSLGPRPRSVVHLFRWALLWLDLALLVKSISLDPQSSSSGSSPGKGHFVGELIDETGFYQAIRLSQDRPLVKHQSDYQLIEVHQSDHYGKLLVLDGVLQLTEKDADSYNEMMAHLPLFQHPSPKRVLVIGGGDGSVVAEVLKHDSVVQVDHVDLDQQVIDVCRQHFAWGKVWDDPRVNLYIQDGAAFVKNAPSDYYDVIIQDSSDPWTWDDDGHVMELPSSALYTKEHMQNIHRVLTENGVLNLQAETLQIPSDMDGIVLWRHNALEVGFVTARYSSIIVSTYPTGQIGCLVCEKSSLDRRPEPAALMRSIEDRYTKMCQEGKDTTYYHPRLQVSSFDLPLWAEKRIYGNVGGVSQACNAAIEKNKVSKSSLSTEASETQE